MTDDMTALQERIAHLEAALDAVSDTVTRQDRAIDTLERKVAMLLGREAAREAEGSGGVVMGDERPPHY